MVCCVPRPATPLDYNLMFSQLVCELKLNGGQLEEACRLRISLRSHVSVIDSKIKSDGTRSLCNPFFEKQSKTIPTID